ncbi:MAG: 4Fe-4S binding protein [Methanocellales archaeon]|nr:4Fe-4S binding protein [Methanocellales archaeon]MDD3291811.1 4Fe-4S binding protein [Methanocellales archaeon]
MMDKGVVNAITSNSLCNIDGLSEIHYRLRKNPDHLIIAGCSNKTLFDDILRYSHFPKENLSLVDIREMSGWVHKDKSEATEKAKRLIFKEMMNVENRRDFEPGEDLKEIVVVLGLRRVEDLVIFGRVESCPGYRFDSCSICIDSCPHGAISSGLSIDPELCNGCEICISVCPLGLLTSKNQGNIERNIKSMLTSFVKKKPFSSKRLIGMPIILFVCDNLAKITLDRIGLKKLNYPADILPVPVSCLSQINLNHILMSFVLGSQGILLCGCDPCEKGSKEYIVNLERTFKSVFEKTCLEERLSVFRSTSRDSNKLHEHMINFFEKINSMDRLNITRVGEFLGNKREDLLLMLKSVLKDGDLRGDLLPFGFIKIDEETCDLCGDCTRACLTNALKIEDGKLIFDHGFCIGCGACVKKCPNSSIELEKVIKVSKLFVTDIVK